MSLLPLMCSCPTGSISDPAGLNELAAPDVLLPHKS